MPSYCGPPLVSLTVVWCVSSCASFSEKGALSYIFPTCIMIKICIRPKVNLEFLWPQTLRNYFPPKWITALKPAPNTLYSKRSATLGDDLIFPGWSNEELTRSTLYNTCYVLPSCNKDCCQDVGNIEVVSDYTRGNGRIPHHIIGLQQCFGTHLEVWSRR